MISTKEDLKNVIELEKKGYGRNSLIRRYLRELRICEYYKNNFSESIKVSKYQAK